jgi:hypothetical protein
MSDLPGAYKLASDVSCENFDGEYVVLNLASGHYFAVSRVGSAVFDGLVSGFDIAEVTDTLAGSEPGRRDWLARAREAGFRLDLLSQVLVRRRVAPGSLSHGRDALKDRGYLHVARERILRMRRAGASGA